MPLPRVAIALGDPAGIGPEIALKAALSEAVRAACVPVLVGDHGVLEAHASACNLAPAIIMRKSAQLRDTAAPAGSVLLIARQQLAADQLQIGRVHELHGRAVLDSVAIAINAALAGEVDAVVAAPATDRAVQAAGVHFDGYTGFAAAVAGAPQGSVFLMVQAGERRVVLATLHVSVRQALGMITPERVDRVLHAADAALKRMGIAAPRLAVAGLNPHAGEEGQFGIEEATIIGPAIARARKAGIDAAGPHALGDLFRQPGVDAHIVMLHDQAHLAGLPAGQGTAYTIGLPFPFASVVHGSALDIAGRNRADPQPLIEAILRVAHARPVAQPA